MHENETHLDVGNKSAVFPLQLLGFDVDVINSVHFSNHTGYPNGWEGDVLNGNQLKSILDGLERNQLLSKIGYLLTGYIGSESFLRSVIDVLKLIRSSSDNDDKNIQRSVRYVCDPVLGDGGKFYVPTNLVSIFRNELIPLADVVTPNQFEVEQLTGIKVRSIKDAKDACYILHDLGPSLVFITSMTLEKDDMSKNGDNVTPNNSIAIFASRRSSEVSGNEKEKYEMWRIDSSIIPGRYTGTGDLCAALLLAWTEIHPNNLCLAMEKVIGTMHAVIKRTAESSVLSNNMVKDESIDLPHNIASMELRLIQSKNDIENPKCMFKAYKIF